jgi:hypothetical protein
VAFGAQHAPRGPFELVQGHHEFHPGAQYRLSSGLCPGLTGNPVTHLALADQRGKARPCGGHRVLAASMLAPQLAVLVARALCATVVKAWAAALPLFSVLCRLETLPAQTASTHGTTHPLSRACCTCAVLLRCCRRVVARWPWFWGRVQHRLCAC